MKNIYAFFCIPFFILIGYNISFSQVLDPNDPIVEYDTLTPPTQPSYGEVGKWVITPEVSWDSDSWKSYIYKGLPFRLRFPNNYDPSRSEEYPMIVILHGYGFSNGTIYLNDRHLNNAGADAFEKAINNGTFDGFVVSPQATNSKYSPQIFQAISELITIFDEELNLDINRVSLNGRSGGAVSVWDFIAAHPTVFSSALPISGISPGTASSIDDYKFIPMWVFQGEKDKGPYPYQTEALISQVEDAGGNINYTLYLGKGHSIMSTVYAEDEFFPFMIASNKVNPWVLYEQHEFCPGDPVNITIGVTPGFDGYEWRKDGVIISGAVNNTVQVTEYGVYDVRVKRGNEWSYWSPEPMVVGEKATTVTPPIVVAESMSHVIPSPNGNTSVILELPEGYESYEWRKVGENTVLGISSTLEVSEPAEYIASVTEKFGCSSNFSDPFKVVNASGVNAPDAINGLVAYAPSKTTIQLDWSDNPNASYNETGFEIYRSLESGTGFSLVHITEADVFSYLDSNLLPNTEYFYILRPVNENGAGPVSSEVATQTQVDSESPSAPLNLYATSVSSTEVSLSWTESVDNVGVSKYDVYQNGQRAIVTSENNVTIYNLVEGKSYNFSVVARDATGNTSPPSNRITIAAVEAEFNYKYYEGTWSQLPDFDTLTPKTTGIFSSIDISIRERDAEFALMWEGFIYIPVAGNYTFETRSDDGSKLYIGTYDEANLVVTNDGTHSMRSREGTYSFSKAGVYPIVVTYFQGGGSGKGLEIYWSNTAHGVERELIPIGMFRSDYTFPEATPEMPTNVVATTISYEEILVTWDDNSNNETSFQVFRATSQDGPFESAGIVGSNVTSFNDTGLDASTTYYYKVQSLGNYGESDFQAFLPTAKMYLRFENDFLNEIDNGLITTPSGSPAFDSVDVKEGIASLSLDGLDDMLSLGSGSGEFHDEFTERTVAFWIKPFSIEGKRMIYDEGGTTNGMAIRLENNNIEVAVRDNSQQKTISYSVSEGEWVHVTTVFNNGRLSLYLNGEEKDVDPNTGYSDVSAHSNSAGLGATNGSSNAFGDNGSPYYGLLDDFQVYRKALSIEEIQKIIEAVNNGLRPFTTTQPLPPDPVNPSNLVANAISSTKITLSWNDESDDEKGFNVYRSTNNSKFNLLTTLEENITTYTDEGLYANVTYYYKVNAFNVGEDTSSLAVFAKTLNNAPELSAIGNQVMRYDSELYINLFGEDADGNQLSYSEEGLPSFGELTDYEDGSALLLFTPVVADTGTYTITISLADTFGGLSTSTFDLIVGENYLPVLSPIENISIQEEDSIEILLSAFDENGVTDLEWSVVPELPSFGILEPGLDGTAILKFSPGLLDGGTYPIEVFVEDPEGAIVSESFVLEVSEASTGFEVFVNLNGEDFDADSPWNNTHKDAADGDEFGPFLDVDGNETSIGIRTSDFGYNTLGATSATGVYPTNVMRTSYWSNRTSETITLYGLSDNYSYEVIFFGSRDETSQTNRNTDFTAGGQTVTLNASQNSTNTVSISALSPDANGEIEVEVSRGSGSSYVYINAFVLRAYLDDGTIPAAAQELSATASEGPEITLSWSDIAYNENGYEVWRSTSDTSSYELLNTGGTTPETTSYEDTSVLGSTWYYYKVRAFNQYGYSDYSNVISIMTLNAPPEITDPGIISVKAGDSSQVFFTATDEDVSDTITLSMPDLPDFAEFEDLGNGNGTLSLSPQESDEGDYSVTILAEDQNGGVQELIVSIVVTKGDMTSVYVNFTEGSIVGSSPWNNTSAFPSSGLTITNLLDDVGIETGISLELLDTWAGWNELGVSDDSGIYPNEVMTTSYWESSGDARRIRIAGLSDSNKYNLIFFGSRDGGGDRTTEYSVGDEIVSLNSSYNSSETVQINGVSPDSLGELVVTIQKASTSTYAYLNAMVIQAYEDNGLPFSPSGLTTSTLSRSAIQLNWVDNSDNETGFEVWRSSTIDGTYTKISTVGSDTISFTDSLLSTGSVYYYQVRAINAVGESDFSNISEGRTLVFAVYVNFNEINPEGAPWNNTSSVPQLGDYYTDLYNDEGNATGINLEITSNFDGVNPYGMSTGDNSGIVPDNVMSSSYWLDFGNTGQLTLSGLSSFFKYNLVFFASRDGGGDRTSIYTIDGESVSLNASYNMENTAAINGVTPDDNGEIIIDISLGDNSSYAYINGLIIQAVESFSASSRQAAQDVQIDSEETIVAIDVYPNPFNDALNLDFTFPDSETIDIILRDLGGRIIYSENKQIDAGNYSYSINLSNSINSVSNGFYLLEINGNKYGRHSYKLIKK